jgi:hypothetical protein
MVIDGTYLDSLQYYCFLQRITLEVVKIQQLLVIKFKGICHVNPQTIKII